MRILAALAHCAALCAVGGLAPLSSGGSTAAAQSLTLEPCRLPRVDESLRCGTYDVWENRSTRAGRKIPLRVVLLPSRTATPAPDVLVVLQGGPGQSNVSTVAGFVNSPFRQERSILFVDVRGTGSSNVLDCDFSAAGTRTDFMPIDGVRACRVELSRNADLAQYTTPLIIEDLEDVFTALGLERVNLLGFSGGTRVALAFMRRYPARVRSALLNGPVPIDARIPLTFARDAQDALDGVLQECLDDAACGRQFPDVKAEFDTVMQRLRRTPAETHVRRAAAMETLQVTHSAFSQVIRYMLYQPEATRMIPLAVHHAAQGDFSLLAERIRTLGIPGGIANGFYLSNTCTEDVPWFELADAVARSANTFLGDYRVRQQRAACDAWPKGSLPPRYLEPVRSDVATLILVGARDPVTPPRWGDEVAKHLSLGRVLVVPDGGHSFAGLQGLECLDRIRAEFLKSVAPAAIDASCMTNVRRRPFLLEADPGSR